MKRFLIAALTLCIALTASAQNEIGDFQKYRQQMLGDYQSFRKSVLDGYADFLNTVWKDYQSFRGVKRDDKPKPKTVPDVKTNPVTTPSDDKPKVKIPNPQSPIEPENPLPKPTTPSVPIVPVVPSTGPTVPFTFYGITLKAPQLQCLKLSDTTPHTVSQSWKTYSQSEVKNLAETLKGNAQALGLNDWFTYEMVRLCVESQFKNRTANERMVLKHFLLANMGYDVRLALQGDEFLLLVGIEEQLYSRRFTNIDGRRYFLFTDSNGDTCNGDYFYTCKLPSDVDLGRQFDMRIYKGMDISSGDTKSVNISWNDMNVTCDIDVKVMEMLRHYPQMDIPMYAESVISPTLREGLLKQLKPYITGLSELDAATELLHFVQFAFAYATDGEQHGYEKSYFLEENFYYPKNDCEDRAIFFAYLIRNLLGLDVHLIQYPGHECTAVHFNDATIKGDGYIYGEKTYIICDPTYIGASVGQCMPDYKTTNPKVQTW